MNFRTNSATPFTLCSIERVATVKVLPLGGIGYARQLFREKRRHL